MTPAPPKIKVLMQKYNSAFDKFLANHRIMSRLQKEQASRKMRELDNEITYQISLFSI